MVYPTYVDCEGETQQLDEFHLHELLDRTHMVRAMFSDFILDHPAAVIAQDKIKEVDDILSSLYQDIGKAVNEIEHSEPQPNAISL